MLFVYIWTLLHQIKNSVWLSGMSCLVLIKQRAWKIRYLDESYAEEGGCFVVVALRGSERPSEGKGRESCNRAMGWVEISNQWKLIEDDMVGELLNFLLRLFELNKCKAETAWNSIVVWLNEVLAFVDDATPRTWFSTGHDKPIHGNVTSMLEVLYIHAPILHLILSRMKENSDNVIAFAYMFQCVYGFCDQ